MPLTCLCRRRGAVVKTLQHPNGGTFTNLAIDAAVDLLAKSRPASEAPDAIVIVTDGATETEAETAASVQRAKNAGIAIFAIGIGQSIQQSDLLKLADANRVWFCTAACGEDRVWFCTAACGEDRVWFCMAACGEDMVRFCMAACGEDRVW